MFAAGNFNAPMLIHDTTPPGVTTMTRLKAEIRYEYSETERGASIRLLTRNAQTLDAIHAFLLFQIIEHRTADSPAIFTGKPQWNGETYIGGSAQQPLTQGQLLINEGVTASLALCICNLLCL